MGSFYNRCNSFTCFLKDYLTKNKDICLLMFKPKFDSFDFILRDVFNISNQIIFLEPIGTQVIFSNEFYCLEVLPFDQNVYCPPIMRKKCF